MILIKQKNYSLKDELSNIIKNDILLEKKI